MDKKEMEYIKEHIERVKAWAPEMVKYLQEPYLGMPWIRVEMPHEQVHVYITQEIYNMIDKNWRTAEHFDIEFTYDDDVTLVHCIIMSVQNFSDFAEWFYQFIQ